jgi:hypothetical protein
MTTFLPIGFRIGSATVMLLTLGLLSIGCSNRPDPRLSNSPPLNAAALSGGKITNFTANPYIPADPSIRSLLESCRKLPGTSSTARSAYVLLKSRKGTQPIPALTIDEITLVLTGSVERMLGGEVDDCSRAVLNLPGGCKQVKIGRRLIHLKYPVVAVNNNTETVISLSDLLTLLKTCDEQRGDGHEIQYIKTTYDLDPNQLFK